MATILIWPPTSSSLPFFGCFMIINPFFGIRYRSWTFLIAMAGGCMTESVGYVGRVLLNDDPFNMQITCLTIVPALIAAEIYLILKHLVICFGEEHSYLKARYYTWLFIACDLLSLTLQGADSGLAATARDDDTMLFLGNNLMIAGISFQVVTLLAFAVMTALYCFRLSRSATQLSAAAEGVKNSTGFKLFVGGLFISFITIFTRCVYRITEMVGGWRNPIMQNEAEFVVLDSV